MFARSCKHPITLTRRFQRTDRWSSRVRRRSVHRERWLRSCKSQTRCQRRRLQLDPIGRAESLCLCACCDRPLSPAHIVNSRGLQKRSPCFRNVQSRPKMAPFIIRLITSPNITRFSKSFYHQNQETIYNKTITIDPATSQVCRYTTLWNVRRRTQADDATDQLRDQRWSSLACGPQITRTWIQSIMLIGIPFNREPINVDDLRQSTS